MDCILANVAAFQQQIASSVTFIFFIYKFEQLSFTCNKWLGTTSSKMFFVKIFVWTQCFYTSCHQLGDIFCLCLSPTNFSFLLYIFQASHIAKKMAVYFIKLNNSMSHVPYVRKKRKRTHGLLFIYEDIMQIFGRISTNH